MNEIKIEHKQSLPVGENGELLPDGVIMFIKPDFLPLLRESTDDTFFTYTVEEAIKMSFTTDKKGNLNVFTSLKGSAIQFNHKLNLTTDDKIAVLTAINKDNNRIKNMMEESKTKDHKTDSLKPYYDAVRSKEIKDGIEWSYIKDGKVEDTAFMSYKQLYEIQINKKTICQFCDETETEFIMPRDQSTGIYLCKQHIKYISRISEKNQWGNYYFIRKSDGALMDMDTAYQLDPSRLAEEYTLYKNKP